MTHRRLVAGLLLLGILAAAQLGKIPQALLSLQAELNLSATAAGWAVSLMTLIAALLGLMAGQLAERLGFERTLIAGVWLLAIAGLFLAQSQTPAALLIWRAVEGVGYLAIIISAPTLVSRFSQGPRRALALALWAAFVPLGFAFIALLFALWSAMLEWRTLFTLSAGLVALAALWMTVELAGLPRAQSTRTTTGATAQDTQVQTLASVVRALLQDPVALGIGLAFGCYATASLMFIAFLPAFLEQRWELQSDVLYTLTALIPLSSLIGNLLAGCLLHFGLSCRLVAACATFLLTLCSLPMYSWHAGDPAISILSAFGVSIASGMAAGGLFAAVPALLRSESRQAQGFAAIAQFGSIGALLGPPLAGSVIALAGWRVMPLLFGVVALLCILALYRLSGCLPGR